MKLKLADRIAQLVTAPATSDAIAALLPEAETEAERAKVAAVEARKNALDPALTQAAAGEAYRDAEQKQFEADRLQVALTTLQERHDAALYSEDQERKIANFKQAEAMRDAFVKKLERLYPRIKTELAMIVTEHNALLDTVVAVGVNRPDGFGAIETPDRIFGEAAAAFLEKANYSALAWDRWVEGKR